MGVALLSGCSSPASQARKKYQFLRDQHASLGEVCAAGRELLKADADAANTAAYGEDRAAVDLDCLSSQLHGSEQPYNEAPILPDNMEAIAPKASGATVARRRSSDNSEIGRKGWNGE